ncbi:MAG: hypothetical protein JO314_11415 [Acidobacteria bacterium]|nr:hypothetical protein [Acidobacteriota bacterium]
MPWSRPWMMQEFVSSTGENIGLGFIVIIFIGFLIGAALLARKNLRLGRGDRRGAVRLSLFVLAVTVLAWIIGADHSPTVDEIARVFYLAISQALCLAALVWLLYVAVEPYVRRRWPEMMVSWSRVLAGQWRNPLVARDILIGLLTGILCSILLRLEDLLRLLIGALPIDLQNSFPINSWVGTRRFIDTVFVAEMNSAIFIGLFFFFVLFLLRVITRRRWAAAILLAVILSVPGLVGSQSYLVVFTSVVIAIVAARFGLLALTVLFFFNDFMLMIDNFAPWFVSYAIVSYVFVLALAGWAFHTSLGGQKLFSVTFLESDE